MYKLDFDFERTDDVAQAQQVIIREMAVENILRNYTVLKEKEKFSEQINGDLLRAYKFTYKMKKGTGIIVYKRYSAQRRYLASVELVDFSKFARHFDEVKNKLEIIASKDFEALRSLDEARVIFAEERI